jgi:hypothetical protein
MKNVLIIVFLSTVSLCAQTVELEAIGASGGVFWAQNKWNPGFAVEINLDMGEVLDYIFLQPTVSFMQAKKNEMINGVEDDLTLRHVTLGTKIIGYITPRPNGPYFGTALNYHYISSDHIRQLELSNSAEIYSSGDQKVSISVLAGYIQKFRDFSIFLETRYTFVPDNFSTVLVTTGFFYNL